MAAPPPLRSQHTQAAYASAMQFVRPKPSRRVARAAGAAGAAAAGAPAVGEWGGHTPVLLASSATGAGMDAVLQRIDSFHAAMSICGALRAKREGQALHWMTAHLQRQLLAAVARAEAAAEEVEAGRRSSDGSDGRNGSDGSAEGGASALGALRRAVRLGRTTPRAAASRALGPVLHALAAAAAADT